MTTHSTIQSPAMASSGPFKPPSSTRKLRTRAPRSYVLPDLMMDDELDSFSRPIRGLPTDKTSILNVQSPDDGCTTPSMNGANQATYKPNGRLKLSREHRVSRPPPLPSCNISYLKSDKFPAWLLGLSMVKSSPNYLNKLDEQVVASSSSSPTTIDLSPSKLTSQTSPIRGNNSPTKFRSSLDRQASLSSSSLRFPMQANGSSTIRPRSTTSIRGENQPEQEEGEISSILDRGGREDIWESYEYDSTAPHLQPRYFNKPLPFTEHWPDLDIQNIAIIPAPINISPTVHLFEVFASSTNSINSNNNLLNHDNEKNTSFGFHFLPLDYNGHQK